MAYQRSQGHPFLNQLAVVTRHRQIRLLLGLIVILLPQI